MKLVVSCLALLAALVAFGPTAGRSATANGPLQSALEADLQQYLDSRSKIEHISTLSLSVNFPGSQPNLNVAVGRSEYGGAGAPVVPSNVFQIGSTTKAFTATALLQLEADGKVSIDQTVGRWLPQYPRWKDVTISQLLHMTSGIPSYDNVPAMLEAYAAHPHRTWTAEQLVAVVYPSPKPVLPSTTGYSYSNTNFVLAQMIVEKASNGASYGSELARRFFRGSPLHLDGFSYSSAQIAPSVLKNMVHGYFYSNDPGNAGLAPIYGHDVWDYTLSWTQGAGGIVGSPEGVTHWARQLYEGAALAPKQRKELMTLVSRKTGKPIVETTADDPGGFGLGVAQMYRPGLGRFWFYEGETLGYRMVHVWLPKQDVIFAFGLNSQPNGNDDQIGELIETIYNTLHAAGKV
jgi:D-alanyl-D-alanine carboxypeptidase